MDVEDYLVAFGIVVLLFLAGYITITTTVKTIYAYDPPANDLVVDTLPNGTICVRDPSGDAISCNWKE